MIGLANLSNESATIPRNSCVKKLKIPNPSPAFLPWFNKKPPTPARTPSLLFSSALFFLVAIPFPVTDSIDPVRDTILSNWLVMDENETFPTGFTVFTFGSTGSGRANPPSMGDVGVISDEPALVIAPGSSVPPSPPLPFFFLPTLFFTAFVALPFTKFLAPSITAFLVIVPAKSLDAAVIAAIDPDIIAIIRYYKWI